MSAMWSNLITVVGMLATGLLSNRVQNRRDRDARAESRRTELMTTVAALVSALADHRRAMWSLENARLTGADPETVAEAVAASHATRSAVTAPLTTVSILAPTLAAPAEDATQAVFAMHNAADASDLDVLEARRQAARDASDRLVVSARAFFALTTQTSKWGALR
jgi:hypothetical protein